MKKIITLTILFGLLSCAYAYAASPAIFYSDLTSGPKTGGQNNKGVFVTISGKNFGATRGTSYVSIGGGQADNYPVWSDTKISFQLGANAASGNITVTTSEGTSNAVPFTVRSGNIYFADLNSPNNPGSGTFADPWRNPHSFYTSAAAGDTCYIRGGTYTGQYGTNNHFNIGIGSETAEGTSINPVAWIGYPGETVIFIATGQAVNGMTIEGNIDIDERGYYIFSGFKLYSSSRASVRIATSGNRIINNLCVGNASFSYAIINPVGCNGVKIYGNELTGAASGNKLQHPLYVGYGSDNVDFGWNRIHDNDVGVGPAVSINQDNANVDGVVFENILIHDNLIDCRNSSQALRAIGVVATDSGSTVYIYNNVIIEPGANYVWDSAIYQISGSLYFYNNTIYHGYGGFLFHVYTSTDGPNTYHPEIVEIKNNIFYNKSGSNYFLIEGEASMQSVDIDYNCYYGNGKGPARDTHAVNANPDFSNIDSYDFHLKKTSPAKDTGMNAGAIVTRDYDGNTRPQGTGFDIGAYEYVSTAPAVSITKKMLRDK